MMEYRKFKLPPFLITTFPNYVLIHYTKIPSFVLKMDDKGTELVKQYHEDPENKIPFLTEKGIEYYLRNTVQDSVDRKPIHFDAKFIGKIDVKKQSIEQVLTSSYLNLEKVKKQTLQELKGVFSRTELSCLLHLIDENIDLLNLSKDFVLNRINQEMKVLEDTYFCEVVHLIDKINDLSFAQLFILCMEMKNFHAQKTEDLGAFFKSFGLDFERRFL